MPRLLWTFFCLVVYVAGSAWLRDEEDERIHFLSQRARASTNLTLDTVEELQVSLYNTR